MRYKCLDLFCCAGGAGEGYRRAGFDVTGVDIRPQKRNPHRFIQADALEFLREHGYEFDFIHASPPCQAFTMANYAARANGNAKHADMIPETRAALALAGKPWIIENVPTAPLQSPIMLCGTMFGLGVFRHRHFESSFPLFAPTHHKHKSRIGDGKMFSVAGGAGRWRSWGTTMRDVNKGSAEEWRTAMGIEWMTRKELTQAIPPAYSEYLGRQAIQHIESANEAGRDAQ